ncbi:MAG: hypothetical protein R3C28_19825 [Pirellulaceae bacterium]
MGFFDELVSGMFKHSIRSREIDSQIAALRQHFERVDAIFGQVGNGYLKPLLDSSELLSGDEADALTDAFNEANDWREEIYSRPSECCGTEINAYAKSTFNLCIACLELCKRHNLANVSSFRFNRAKQVIMVNDKPKFAFA